MVQNERDSADMSMVMANPTITSAGRDIVTGSGGLTWDDLRRKATRRIAERIDPVRNKHKPLSILRQEAKRAVEQFFETEFPYVAKDDRNKISDEILSDALGLGPLEELFRDEGVREILILGPSQVIVNKADKWIPSSVFFRDYEHVNRVISRTIEQGEPIHPGQTFLSGVDVRLPNGFRVVGIMPPAVMEIPPTVALVRWAAKISGPIPVPGQRTVPVGSGIIAGPASRNDSSLISTPGPRSGSFSTSRSGAGLLSGSPALIDSNALEPHDTPKMTAGLSRSGIEGPASGGFGNDPYAKMRGKITQRFIAKIAAAGVYDLSQIPKAELKRIVASMVDEVNLADKLNLNSTETARLTLEIIAGMQV